MPATGLKHHTSRRFEADLERVRNDVLRMGEFVELQLQSSVAALQEANDGAAGALAEGDAMVNRMELSIDRECLRILATRMPAAGDLRLIVGIIKAVTDLERIGDEAEKVGYIAARLATMEHPTDRYREIRQLGSLAREMVHDALNSFARMDSDAALAVARRDRAVDEAHAAIQREQVTLMQDDAGVIRRALEVVWLVRALERIGDHAKNICEQVVYIVHGKDVRHLGSDQLPGDLHASRQET